VAKGRPRQDGYVLVQRNAMKTFHGEGRFLDNLLADADVRALLTEEELRAAFDLDHALAHCKAIVERAIGAEEG
jgi:adenylosuccinate lyase